jgi:hypothetical protein
VRPVCLLSWNYIKVFVLWRVAFLLALALLHCIRGLPNPFKGITLLLEFFKLVLEPLSHGFSLGTLLIKLLFKQLDHSFLLLERLAHQLMQPHVNLSTSPQEDSLAFFSQTLKLLSCFLRPLNENFAAWPLFV